MIVVTYANLSVEHLANYGKYVAVVNIHLKNNGIIPRIYRASAEFYSEGKSLGRVNKMGIVRKKAQKIEVLELYTDKKVDKARLKVSAPFGVRVYYDKELNPS